MSDYALLALARALHVLGVVIWIGGVAMVTLVILPAIRQRFQPAEQAPMFEMIEHRFARIAQATTLLTGISGFFLVERLGLWGRFADPHYWWMHAMVGIWAIFSLILFVLEPLWLHRWFSRRASQSPAATFRLVQRLHGVLLAISLLTILGAVAGSHGL
ncbi:putative membrane protein [Chitinivorax tropicus]|uniref:Putative membrane protein n=1 Tax=Chitinivorax tropicus TaxID=714531 RepID=A0A840MI71_9PROT|nr:hypothetical protein [Chitinivorax tropicus]MBB5018100.1 putative membrane protein [Chitinivorax tropicus]